MLGVVGNRYHFHKYEPDDRGDYVNLGYKQGVGTKTLSDSILNYPFIFIQIGYYSSGSPCFGSSLIPVSRIHKSDNQDYAFNVICTGGSVSVNFTDTTTLKVNTSYNQNHYIVIYGIK